MRKNENGVKPQNHVMPAAEFCLPFCSLSLLLFETTFVVLDPSTKEWCKSQLERFSGLKDYPVHRRMMKEEDFAEI